MTTRYVCLPLLTWMTEFPKRSCEPYSNSSTKEKTDQFVPLRYDRPDSPNDLLSSLFRLLSRWMQFMTQNVGSNRCVRCFPGTHSQLQTCFHLCPKLWHLLHLPIFYCFTFHHWDMGVRGAKCLQQSRKAEMDSECLS